MFPYASVVIWTSTKLCLGFSHSGCDATGATTVAIEGESENVTVGDDEGVDDGDVVSADEGSIVGSVLGEEDKVAEGPWLWTRTGGEDGVSDKVAEGTGLWSITGGEDGASDKATEGGGVGASDRVTEGPELWTITGADEGRFDSEGATLAVLEGLVDGTIGAAVGDAVLGTNVGANDGLLVGWEVEVEGACVRQNDGRGSSWLLQIVSSIHCHFWEKKRRTLK